MIRLENIHKAFGAGKRQKVLEGFNLDVRAGETFVILGRSGVGKSVTLKHIVGLLKPDRGRVIVDGEDITRANRKTLFRVRRKVAYLFQSTALINWLSVGQNVELPLNEHTRLPPAEIRSKALAALEDLDMAAAFDKMPSEISGGMKKRAALARVLVMNPDIILYDEPTAGLDPIMAKNIARLIKDVQQKHGVTSIIVTHDLECAFAVADRIGMHHKGSIIEVGTPEQIRNSSNAIVRAFLRGEGPDNATAVSSRAEEKKEEPG